ncbi:heat shock 70 kDa protein 16-like isoform X2 [Populus alba x Populus x berolinensis]|uniref:Heat shock 70 kDa protein 16-like isoform X2 n=1 Tax=Populus alba x Populus x berolinensis TaxID=444605 RepID=A0AAD6QZG8_9ROSI|nr:heat shock 70 kDa protein 16-like isoform X2 [Populus alba x Populus x berolinensis]
MSVVGFDFGNENCVIAVAKERGIDVLLNDESNRETPAVVSFFEKQRFMGSEGAASLTMNPKSTVSQVKRLIGRKFKEVEVQDDLKLFPFEIVEGHDGGILIKVQYLGEIHEFSPVQILGMLFSHLKQIAEKSLEMPISYCVIGIPCYFTDLQRRAYLNAAAIAGLRPLRLLHDCTATALGYGIYKNDISNAGPTYVVFVDIGHCDTQVCLASFERGQMKILSHAFDRNLGGRDFDEVLFSYFAAQFKENDDIDVCTNMKASIRLRASCEKLKKVLSANAEAPLNIECLMDEKDVRGFIKREEFERLSSDLVESISVPCQKVLANSGLTVEKIHSVELVGSGSRIPAITRMLASLFKREPSRRINASECVARGCALQCAMLSPILRVREYQVQDSFPFSIGLSSDKVPIFTLPNSTLFPKGQAFPSLKILALHRNNMFQMEAFYADPNELPFGIASQISSFMIGPFPVYQLEMVKVKVRVQLNLHGIVNIEAFMQIEDGAEVTNVTSENMVAKSDHSPSVEQNGAEVTNVAQSAPSSIPEDEIRKGKIFKRLEIPVSEEVYGGMTKAELSEAEKIELQLAQQDLKMERIKDKKNALESYVYEMRDKIFSKYQSFATESERNEISINLQKTEEWLYEDEPDDESENIYNQKLEDLRKLVDPIEIRYKEDEAREKARKDLLSCIADYRMNAGSLTAVERDAVIDECNKAEKWLQEKTQEQDSLPKNVDPVLWSCEIKRKAEGFDAYCSHILRLAIFISAVEPNYLGYFTFCVLCYRVVYIQYLNSIVC